jgi:hypothetical protein
MYSPNHVFFWFIYQLSMFVCQVAPMQWVSEAPSLGVKLPGSVLTIHVRLVLTSRMRGAIAPLLHTSS